MKCFFGISNFLKEISSLSHSILFLRDQCKEIEEKNRMGKTRDFFKKIRDTKETLHAKMGTIKDRNGMDLTEAEDIKKRCKNTQKNYARKIFMNGVITYLEPDILECNVKWALGSITTNKDSGADGIPVEPFAFLHYFSLGIILIAASCTMS